MMSSEIDRPHTDDAAVVGLYHQLLACWNRRDAECFGALFEENGTVVGFDGSQMNGRAEIVSTLAKIFADHRTATYVGKVKEVRLLSDNSALLRAIGGTVPRGQNELNVATNTIHSLTAIKRDGEWHIAHYHNTPAQFHGRPDLVLALTEELRELL